MVSEAALWCADRPEVQTFVGYVQPGSTNAFEVSGIKRFRQKILNTVPARISAHVSQNNLSISAREFPDHLTTTSTRRRDLVVIRYDCNFHDLTLAVAHGLEYCDSLGTHA